MKKYTVVYAEDVPHYGVLDIEASDDASAIEVAKSREVGSIAHDADYENSVCRRIVHITDEQDNIIAENMALDHAFLAFGSEADRLLAEDAPMLLSALEDAVAQLEICIDFSDPEQDPILKIVTDEARSLVAKHRRPQ